MKRTPHKTPRSSNDARQVVRSDSRPLDCTTVFTSRGDSLTGIGDGKVLVWDFSNSQDEVAAPEGFKRKRIEFGFSELVHIKEGTFYFFDAPKGCYADFYVVCKSGGYYQDPNGAIPGSALGQDPDTSWTQATEDTIVLHYVNHHHLQGSVPMGDELNTEGASENGLPPQQLGYIVRLEITTPDTDESSNGCAELEVYRKRTNLLPGEDL